MRIANGLLQRIQINPPSHVDGEEDQIIIMIISNLCCFFNIFNFFESTNKPDERYDIIKLHYAEKKETQYSFLSVRANNKHIQYTQRYMRRMKHNNINNVVIRNITIANMKNLYMEPYSYYTFRSNSTHEAYPIAINTTTKKLQTMDFKLWKRACASSIWTPTLLTFF